ncbi:MAG: GNAT family N-acetyltransferase [Pirellulales bacterium]
MSDGPTLQAGPLKLRPWRASDLAPFAALNADPRVMEFLPAVLDREASDAMAGRIRDHFARHGYGLWAVEAPGETEFAGFVGLNVPTFTAHFTPCVEVGWRLAREHWGKGYATIGARAALDFAFGRLQFDEVVALTVPDNVRSRGVMERLGMTHSADDDFDHPNLPVGHRLRRHVLYRLARPPK